MSILYKPVLIGSAEQAEALPNGTIARHVAFHPQEKNGDAWGRHRNTNEQIAEDGGWMALVPIEAEEETNTRWDEGDPVNTPTRKRRLVTPWEEA